MPQPTGEVNLQHLARPEWLHGDTRARMHWARHGGAHVAADDCNKDKYMREHARKGGCTSLHESSVPTAAYSTAVLRSTLWHGPA